MRTVLFTLIFFCTGHLAFSQAYYSWKVLPDVNLATSENRFEDMFFLNVDTGFAVAYDSKIYKTYDGGKYWYLQSAGFPFTNFRSIEFLDDQVTGIAGSLSGALYYTNDAGINWKEISSAITDTTTINPKSMCGLSHYGNTFYGVGWWGSKTARFYKSTDKGVTWTTTYMDTNLISGMVDVQFISQDTGFVTGCVNKTYGFPAEAIQSVILRTNDGGITWKKVFSDTTIGGRVWKIQVLNRNYIVGSIEPYYYPDSVNMVRSTDGGNTFTMIHAGSTHTAIYTFTANQGIGFATTKKGWLGGYYTGIFETKDGGLTWDTLDFGHNLNRFFVLDSNHIYAGGATAYLYSLDSVSHVSEVYEVRHPKNYLNEISPNPCSGHVKIDFSLTEETNIVLQVANLESKHVFQIESKRLKPGHYTYYWDGTNMPSGNYMVWLGTDEIPMVRKFSVVH